MYETISYEQTGRVATISLNRPVKLYAISPTMMDELKRALSEADGADDVRVVVVRGNGTAFCSGYDIDPSSAFSDTTLSIDEDRERCRGLVRR